MASEYTCHFSMYASAVIHGAIGCSKKKYMLGCFLVTGHLSRVSRQSHLSAGDKSENKVKSGAVHRSPGIYLRTGENPEHLS